jgi:cellulose synthase/poly-beta-1,6-N-acetylglucosamine synthase-like glycosyltransferase
MNLRDGENVLLVPVPPENPQAVTGSPLVLIMTPAYNRASYLDETISSMLNQDYKNIEYILLWTMVQQTIPGKS